MDWLSELFGFLIVLLLFFLPLLKKLLGDKRRVEKREQRGPEAERREEEVFEEEEEEVIEEEPLPPPLPPVTSHTPAPLVSPPTPDALIASHYAFHTDLEERSSLEERSVGTRVAPHFKEQVVSKAFLSKRAKKRGKHLSPVETLLHNYPPLQAMVVLSELINHDPH